MRNLVLEENVLIQKTGNDQHLETIEDQTQEIKEDPTLEIVESQFLGTDDVHHLEEGTDIEDLDLVIPTNLGDLDRSLTFESMLLKQRRDLHPALQKIHNQLKNL